MNGQTRRSAAHSFGGGRPPIDHTAPRYFVYFLRDANGAPVYIGRSCNVAARIKAHAANDWITEVRSVDMTGPYTWREACDEERRQIEAHQPRANRDLTARDRRPAIAARSKAASDA